MPVLENTSRILFVIGTLILVFVPLLVLAMLIPEDYTASDFSFIMGMECDGKPTDSMVVSGRSSLAGLMSETKQCVRVHLESRAFDVATGFYEFHAGTLLLFVYTLHFLVGYLKFENGAMMLVVKLMALLDLLLEFVFLCSSIVSLRSFTSGDDGWGWEARYGTGWEDALLENNNPFLGGMMRVMFGTLLLRLLMMFVIIATFCADSCAGEGSALSKTCDGKYAQLMKDVYAVAFIALLVLTGLSVFWFYLASMDDPLSFSWTAGCDDAVNSTSSYDLQMRVCYGVQDPIANPSASLLRQIMTDAEECSYSLPEDHPYNTPAYQAILASGSSPLLSLVPSQAVTVTSDEFGDETTCIVKKCVGESVIRHVREAARGYYSFYVAVLVFYLLTLAEGIEFIKDISTAWYVRLRLVLGIFALGEVAAFVLASVGAMSANSACPNDLDFNNPPAKTYNDLTIGSTVVRCVAIIIYAVCYILARFSSDVDDNTRTDAVKPGDTVKEATAEP